MEDVESFGEAPYEAQIVLFLRFSANAAALFRRLEGLSTGSAAAAAATS